MKNILVTMAVLSLLVISGCGAKNSGQVSVKTSDQGTEISSPDVNISTDDNGNTEVVLPGVSGATDEDGNVSVSVPGIEVNTTEDGGVTVETPDVNVDTTGSEE